MRKCCVFFLFVPALGGCGGHYILTATDTLAPAGGEAPVVCRLQRNDFFVLALTVDKALVRYSINGGPMRGVYTDDLGYAGTTVPVPDEPGRYRLLIEHTDSETGDEAAVEKPLYVWDASKPAVAVDLDCLPWLWPAAFPHARTALQKVAGDANVLYLTRRQPSRHERAHARLRAAGFPDGPILMWQRERWHIVRGKYRIPRIVVESRLVNQLPLIKETFPNLKTGVCDSSLAAKAFADAGMDVVVIGGVEAKAGNVIRRESWKDLAEKGP